MKSKQDECECDCEGGAEISIPLFPIFFLGGIFIAAIAIIINALENEIVITIIIVSFVVAFVALIAIGMWNLRKMVGDK